MNVVTRGKITTTLNYLLYGNLLKTVDFFVYVAEFIEEILITMSVIMIIIKSVSFHCFYLMVVNSFIKIVIAEVLEQISFNLFCLQ